MLAGACFEPPSLMGALDQLAELVPTAGVALLTAHTMFATSSYLGDRPACDGVLACDDLRGVAASEQVVMVAVRVPGRSAPDVLDDVRTAFRHVGVPSLASLLTVDVSPMGVSKAHALDQLAGALPCSPEMAVAFGDMPNDLPMLDWAGWSCAPANADSLLLQTADEVVPRNDHDGVAYWIEQLLAGTRPRARQPRRRSR